MIPLYMDEHVPRAITTGLRLRGVDVLTVQEDNFSGKSDRELLDRATQPFYGVIFAHHLRVSIGTCIKDLELLAKFSEVEEVKNQVVFLPLKKS